MKTLISGNGRQRKRYLLILLNCSQVMGMQTALCPGHNDKSEIPKNLSEILSKTCTKNNVLLFQEAGKGTGKPCAVSCGGKPTLCRSALCKCYSLNGNTPGRVVLPGASRSKEEMGEEGREEEGGGGRHFVFYSNIYHLKIKMPFPGDCAALT